MNFHILTLFPEMVNNGLNTSIIGRAMEQGHISIESVNIRDFSTNKHKKTDDYPYGGGAGMLMQAQPVFDAYQSVAKDIPREHKKRVIYVTPQGYPFTQKMAENLAQNDDLIFLCGHYEGIDERVLEEIVTDYVSIGDYVLTGGELAAMVMVDAIARLVPGVLHNEISAETESFHGELLEYPQYSRPEVWHEKSVPDVLLSGNQKKIDAWRLEQSIIRTKERRPDLYKKYSILQECKTVLMKQKLLHIDMIELINRGRAVYIAKEKGKILLQDKITGIYQYTDLDLEKNLKCIQNTENKEYILENSFVLESILFLKKYLPIKKSERPCIILHQPCFIEALQLEFGYIESLKCYQAVYTQKNSLSIAGLYRTDGKETKEGVKIQQLTLEHLAFVLENYHYMSDVAYLRACIVSGNMYGAFLQGKPVGFIGIHDDGSIGILEVLEQYRRRKIGKALETYMINLVLQLGWIPYGQVIEGNESSIKMQADLGLYLSKTPIVWMW